MLLNKKLILLHKLLVSYGEQIENQIYNYKSKIIFFFAFLRYLTIITRTIPNLKKSLCILNFLINKY